MIGCLRTRIRKHPITAHYFEFESFITSGPGASKMHLSLPVVSTASRYKAVALFVLIHCLLLLSLVVGVVWFFFVLLCST